MPVFERVRDKSAPGLLAGVALLLHILSAWLRLIPEVALRLLRCDALIVGYIGQGDMVALAPIARLLHKPVIFNPLVTLTDTLVEDRARLRVGSPPARIIAALDELALRLADLILVDTLENGRYLHERFDVPTTKLVVVPVGADESIFYPGAVPVDRRDDLDVLFIGKFIPLHGIETIIQAAALLRERGAAARIEIVGTGQTYEAMRALARQLGLDSAGNALVWTDWIPFEQLGGRLRMADVALGVFGDGEKAARVIPNKVFQSTACGVATVTLDAPAIRTLLHDDVSALLIPPADPHALADAIERLTDPLARERIARAGREAFERHGNLDALASALTPVVAHIADASARARPQ